MIKPKIDELFYYIYHICSTNRNCKKWLPLSNLKLQFLAWKCYEVLKQDGIYFEEDIIEDNKIITPWEAWSFCLVCPNMYFEMRAKGLPKDYMDKEMFETILALDQSFKDKVNNIIFSICQTKYSLNTFAGKSNKYWVDALKTQTKQIYMENKKG